VCLIEGASCLVPSGVSSGPSLGETVRTRRKRRPSAEVSAASLSSNMRPMPRRRWSARTAIHVISAQSSNFGSTVRKAHDLAVALGREPRLNPNCGGAIAPPLVVTEVVRQGRNDGITRLGVPLSKPTDQHRHTFTLPIRHPAKDQKLVEPTHESAVQTEAGEALRYTSGYELRRWRCDRYARMMRAVPALGEMMVSCPSPHLTWYRTLNSPTVTFTTSPSRAGEPT
jgi:hypothetical protein